MQRLWQPMGKYREIVLAMALFVVFDLAILILNFTLSYQIESDAAAINLAGRQRMLSQRVAKSLMMMDADAGAARPLAEAQSELRSAARLFGETLAGFRHGGTVSGSEGRAVKLKAIDTAAGHAVLDRTEAFWHPLADALAPVIDAGTPGRPVISTAVLQARQVSPQLLLLTNALTSELEETARRKADRLRRIQAIGIVLALLNFVFIVFKFVRRLNEADSVADVARRQTRQILGTVREGLFLLTPARTIGATYSDSLASILGRPIEADAPFLPMLADMVSAADHQAAVDFIDLLFSPRVRESLIAELNPLAHMQFTPPGGSARHLAVSFTRVVRAEKVESLLVTVQDISERVQLASALQAAQDKAASDTMRLITCMDVQPAALASVASEGAELLRQMARAPDATESGDAETRLVLDAFFRVTHMIRVRAIANRLPLLDEYARHLEVGLRILRDRSSLSPPDLDPLYLQAHQLAEKLALLGRIGTRLVAQDTWPLASAALHAEIQTLAATLADRLQKQVDLDMDLRALDALPAATQRQVRAIVLQIVFNAVMHGLETPDTRALQAKPAAGRMVIQLRLLDGPLADLVVRDDGCGMDPAALRDALVDSGRASPIELEQLSDRQVMMKVFEPGFSTAADPDDAHGAGLDVVRHCINALGGHLRLASTKHEFTEFGIRFPV